MDNIEVFKSRKLIPQIMKTIFFLIPIGLITNNIFTWIYGDYYFSFKNEIDLLVLRNGIVSFVIFSLIYLIAYYIETELLPMIIISVDKKYNINSGSMQKKIKLHNMAFEKLLGKSFLKKYKGTENKNLFKFSLFSFYMYFPITIVLWLIAFNTIVCYVLIPIMITIAYYIYKAINTYLNECDRLIQRPAHHSESPL